MIDEKAVNIIGIDLLNKKIIIRGDKDTTVVFKCRTITELMELNQKCKDLFKTYTSYYR